MDGRSERNILKSMGTCRGVCHSRRPIVRDCWPPDIKCTLPHILPSPELPYMYGNYIGNHCPPCMLLIQVCTAVNLAEIWPKFISISWFIYAWQPHDISYLPELLLLWQYEVQLLFC